MVRRDFLTENTKFGITIALLDVTKNLIIGPVFFDDINDMLNEARFTVAFWKRFGCDTGPWFFHTREGLGQSVVGQNLCGEDF